MNYTVCIKVYIVGIKLPIVIKYFYKATAYFKGKELISVETNDPNFSLEEIKGYETNAIERLDIYIKSSKIYE